MFANLKRHWRAFERSSPGTRFQRQYESRKPSRVSTIALGALGLLLLAAGIVLLFVPGPGLLLIALGAGLIARQSLWLARRVDRIELLLRTLAGRLRKAWTRASRAARLAIAATLSLLAIGAACGAYALFAGP